MPSGAMKGLDPDRVLSALDDLAKIGRDPAGGITRPAFSPALVEAEDWLLEAMGRAGLAARRDAAGNVIGRAGPADAPAVVIGSHIDTVPNGGAYDGALGVIAGIECARALAPLVVAGNVALEVVAFADEEGAYASLFGSRSMTGRHDPDVVAGTKGETLAALMARCGLDLSRAHEASRPPSAFAAYLELHIEQGPLLETAGIPIGVVTAITGCDALHYRFEGAARHAGTTSMTTRRDAGRGAARAICDAYDAFEAAGLPDTARMTFGGVRFRPGTSNVVPGVAEVVSEVRSPDAGTLSALRQLTSNAFEAVARAQRLGLTTFDHVVEQPESLSPVMADIVEQSARAEGLAAMRLPSGAVHDAQMFAPIVPTGMIFVPSRDGISHHPDEYTAPDQIAHGTRVLARAASAALAAASRR